MAENGRRIRRTGHELRIESLRRLRPTNRDFAAQRVCQIEYFLLSFNFRPPQQVTELREQSRERSLHPWQDRPRTADNVPHKQRADTASR